MHKRIKELVLIAEGYAATNQRSPRNYDFLFQEKFADLIVKECMLIGRQAQIDNQLIDASIKDHFGVDDEQAN